MSVDSYCWNLVAPSVTARGCRPHTYRLDSCLRKHEKLCVSHHRAPSLVCFYFISLPPLCSSAFSPSPVWSGCRGQRSRVYRNYLRWNRFVKLLIMHTSLFHMFSRKQTVLTFYCECFGSLLNGIRVFILVKNRKMFDFYSRRKKKIFVEEAFFLYKILQLFSSFSYF